MARSAMDREELLDSLENAKLGPPLPEIRFYYYWNWRGDEAFIRTSGED
jgi:hypothetical protein